MATFRPSATRALICLAVLFLGIEIFLAWGAPMLPDDRSFFVLPEADDKNALSESQLDAATDHFANPDACKHLWRWALIGPNEWLLKGTTYVLIRVRGGELHYSRGYWGGDMLLGSSIFFAKSAVEDEATIDCQMGFKP